MNFVKYVRTSHEREAFSSLLILFGFICLGFVLANIVMILLVVVHFASESGLSLDSINNGLNSLLTSKSGWWTLVIAQGASAVIMFILTALIYWYAVEKKKWSDFNSRKEPLLYFLLFTLIIHLTFLPFSSYLGSINEAIQLPESLSGLERMMKNMEESAKELTDFIGKSDTFGQLFASFLVMAVIAGIGEELIFRGLIQRKFMKAFKNYHVAIWVSAFIFSAIHFQFYGFLPRLMLGALFGYLYVWSGNIWVPIFAHILNNALAVLLLHLVNKGQISPEIEKLDTIPFPMVVGSSFVCIVLLYTFYNKFFRSES